MTLRKELILNNAHSNQLVLQNEFDPIGVLIQQFNNQIIDKLVLAGILDKSKLNGKINSLISPYVQSKYFNVFNNPYISSTAANKVLTEQIAAKVTKQLTDIVEERIRKNIEVIVEVKPDNVSISKEYNSIVKKNNRVNRFEALKKASSTGLNTDGLKYSYNQLKGINETITRYTNNKATNDFYEINYKESLANGETPKANAKVWMWSMLENTRHSGMDGQEVFLFDKFEVLNEVAMTSDLLYFPRDIQNDHNNCSNICNCRCYVMYILSKNYPY